MTDLQEGAKLITLDNIVRVITYDEAYIPAPELQVDPGPKPYCKHEHINIYKYHRKLYCKDCGATLDAFDWVVLMGEKEGMQFANLKWLN